MLLDELVDELVDELQDALVDELVDALQDALVDELVDAPVHAFGCICACSALQHTGTQGSQALTCWAAPLKAAG